MIYAAAVLLGYLVGSINPAYFFGKMKGFDIRTRGSMNAGASNAKITLGWKYFVMVLVYDFLKSALSYFLFLYLSKGNTLAAIVAGCSAVFGHCYPFYLEFKGGKGFASYIGLMFAINWKFGICVIVIGLILSYLANYICVATFLTCVSVPSYAVYMHLQVLWIILLVCTSGIILWKHRVNVVKFLRKEEIGINGNKIGIKVLKEAK